MYSHRRISDDRLIIDMHATYTYMYSHRRISDDRRLIIDMHATYTLTCTAIEGLVMTED